MRRRERRQGSRKRVLLKSTHSRTRAATRGALCDAKRRRSSSSGIPPPGLFRKASISLGFDGQSFQLVSKTGYAQWRSIVQARVRMTQRPKKLLGQEGRGHRRDPRDRRPELHRRTSGALYQQGLTFAINARWRQVRHTADYSPGDKTQGCALWAQGKHPAPPSTQVAAGQVPSVAQCRRTASVTHCVSMMMSHSSAKPSLPQVYQE
jgi:hypothetical protein